MILHEESVRILDGLLTDAESNVCISGSDEDRRLIQNALDKLKETVPENIKDVWVTYGNTNLTDGYGTEYPIAVCEYKSTANRLGKKKYVQGTDCPVRKGVAIYCNGRWLSHVRIEKPTEEDIQVETKTNAMQDAENKALSLGLTPEEIIAIKG